jgi:cation-transporting ATPase E
MIGQDTQMASMSGLRDEEVARRVASGLVNADAGRTSRSVGDILRANVLTRFNALIGALCVLVLIFGSPLDAVFGLVIVFNSAVGVVQEVRAKRLLDRLARASLAPVRLRRGGSEVTVPPDQIVIDDLVLLGPGDRVPVDGIVVDSHELEIDESLLTGESDPVVKEPGHEVMSGAFAVAGTGCLRATRVGADAYAAKLVSETNRFSLAESELYQGINRFLRYLTWVVVPVGALLVVRQFTSGASVADAVIGSVAGVVPMIPEGLVLLTSIAFAVGVIRLGRRRCLVQELPAVELLARVDTLCLDKTGTLTEPGLRVREIVAGPGVAGAQAPPDASAALAALAAADPRPNPTMAAIAPAVGPAPGWTATDVRPFSSARKYSGATFAGQGTWLLGAADVLLDDPAWLARAEELDREGLRVLALARSSTLDSVDRVPVALVVLEQKLREAAAPTLRYFARQGVRVKVISGDNATSVATIAAKLDLADAGAAVDARTLPGPGEALADAVDAGAVFGRVTPQQKRDFVGALRRRGHIVAMTGDGVNDALALKDADLGVAMGSGAGATRAVSKIVLLDDDFTVLPYLVSEGRRVLANIERVANLFLTKTVYAIVLAVLVGLAHLPFPFLPRHITLVTALTIGVPGFFLALAPSDERARAGFVPRVLRFAVPAGIACATASFVSYAAARVNEASDLVADRSAATLTLFLVAFWVLVLVARPLNSARVLLLAGMLGVFVVVAVTPGLREVAQLSYGDPGNDVLAVVIAAVGAVAISLWVRVGRAAS